MSEKMVLVPQSKLDKLEESRRALYDMLPETNNGAANILNIMELQKHTQVMWELANTKWEEAK